MNNDNDFYHEDEEMLGIVHRYEDMKRNNQQYYFDVAEFEHLINFYIEHNKFGNANEATEFACNQHPSSINIRVKKAQLLIEGGRPYKGFQMLIELEKLEPSNTEILLTKGVALLYLGKLKEARREFNNALDGTYDDKDEVLYNIAFAYQQFNHYRLAVKLLEEAIDINPDNDSVMYDLAFCYERIGNNTRSIEYYRKFLDENPFSENAWYNLGLVYNKLEDYNKAIEAYDFAIAIRETYSSAYFNKANTLANAEHHEAAIEVYQEFLEIEPDNSLAICYIGECYEKLENYSEALKYYRRAIFIDRNMPDAWYGIAVIFYETKRIMKSLFFVKHALQLDDGVSDYWFLLGNINTQLGFLQDAIISYKKATELDVYDFDAWLNFSLLYFRNEMLNEAISILEEASVYNPDNAPIHYRLAAYWLLDGNRDLGYKFLKLALAQDVALYEEFLQFYPDVEDAPQLLRLIQHFLRK